MVVVDQIQGLPSGRRPPTVPGPPGAVQGPGKWGGGLSSQKTEGPGQVAMPLLFLSAFNYPNLFYCHFPDKLCDATLAQPSRSLLRTLYRFLFDTVEEWCGAFCFFLEEDSMGFGIVHTLVCYHTR